MRIQKVADNLYISILYVYILKYIITKMRPNVYVIRLGLM